MQVSASEGGTSTQPESLPEAGMPVAQSSQPSGAAIAGGAKKGRGKQGAAAVSLGSAFGVAFGRAGVVSSQDEQALCIVHSPNRVNVSMDGLVEALGAKKGRGKQGAAAVSLGSAFGVAFGRAGVVSSQDEQDQCRTRSDEISVEVKRA